MLAEVRYGAWVELVTDNELQLVAEPPKKPRRKLSKAELREQAAAAFLAWPAGQTSKNK